MLQVVQDIRNGRTRCNDVGNPIPTAGSIVVANAASLISAGTEKMVMDIGKMSLVGKARARPDQVKRVLEKVRSEGLLNTMRQVRAKLDEPMPMGYSSAGIVLACGPDVQHFKPGDRVASNGPHSEVVSVPRNLCAPLPENVSFEQGAFAVLGSIALQGVRLAQCPIGSTALVVGLGLVGQLTVALLNASGVRVLGTDPDADRCQLALQMGAAVARPGLSADDIQPLTGGLGADAVILCASTKSNGPIELAAGAVRKKGRVVLVGTVGLQLDRRPFYFKEAELVVSCSYGPGRYDPEYEDRGHDYPAAYVRWTERRNIEAVLQLIAAGKLDVQPLISHRFPIHQAEQAYQMIEQGSEPFLGIVLQYAPEQQTLEAPPLQLRPAPATPGAGRCGILGTGNFARMVLLPAIRQSGQLHIAKVCSGKGLSATHVAEGFAAETVCASEQQILEADDLDTVFILSRHDQHARQVLQAIQAGKHVFVEKPLCLTFDQLHAIHQALGAWTERRPLLMVGFNRRFAPQSLAARNFFADCAEPLTVSIRFNAGAIPADHWTQHPAEGGGRIVGEACHAIDLATYLTGSLPVRVFAESVRIDSPEAVSDDQCFITMRHANGSISNIAYLAGGDKAFAKERVEVIGGGRVAVIDDFRALQTCRGGKTKTVRGTQNKGHAQEVTAFAQAVRSGGDCPIPWAAIQAVTTASLLAVQSLRDGFAHHLDEVLPS